MKTNCRRLRNLWRAAAPPLLMLALVAPASSSRAEMTNTAGRAWFALTNWSQLPPPMSWQTNPPTKAQLAQFDDRQAAHAGALADQARDFYTRFPRNPNASRARVTEVQALQLAVRFGATNRLADLKAREDALIQNTNAPAELRYQLRLDEIGRELKLTSTPTADVDAKLETAGRELIRGFPAGPAGYAILLGLAQRSDMQKTREFGELMAHSDGPAHLTELGQGLLRRVDAVGKPLPIAFTTRGGRAVNLTTLSNKVVLVDFWATWCPECVALEPEIKRLYNQFHPDGFEVVGINFDDETNAVQKFLSKEGVSWPQYLGGLADNKFGREYAVNVNGLPSIWLVDRKGIVCDIHGTIDLAAKVAKLMAQ